MKLVRDFFRLRNPGRFPLTGRRQAVRPPFTVTVPAPLAQRQAERALHEASPSSRPLHWVSGH